MSTIYSQCISHRLNNRDDTQDKWIYHRADKLEELTCSWTHPLSSDWILTRLLIVGLSSNPKVNLQWPIFFCAYVYHIFM